MGSGRGNSRRARSTTSTGGAAALAPQAENVWPLRQKLRELGYGNEEFLGDGDLLDALQWANGSINEAAQQVISTEALNKRMLTRKNFDGTLPSREERGLVDCRSDAETQAFLGAVLDVLNDRGVDNIPIDGVTPVVELAVALPRSLARRGAFIRLASETNVADVVVNLWGRGERNESFVPPMAAIQGLYPEVSMNGHNLGYAREQDYGEATLTELPENHRARWQHVHYPYS